MSSGRSRSAASATSALGGFVVARGEGQIEVLPVRHPAQLGELQHDAALRLKHGIVDGVEIVRIDKREVQRKFAGQVLELGNRSAVKSAGRNDVVARFESLDQRGRRGQAGREGQRLCASFERGQALLQGPPVRVVFA